MGSPGGRMWVGVTWKVPSQGPRQDSAARPWPRGQLGPPGVGLAGSVRPHDHVIRGTEHLLEAPGAVSSGPQPRTAAPASWDVGVTVATVALPLRGIPPLGSGPGSGRFDHWNGVGVVTRPKLT